MQDLSLQTTLWFYGDIINNVVTKTKFKKEKANTLYQQGFNWICSDMIIILSYKFRLPSVTTVSITYTNTSGLYNTLIWWV